METSTPEKAEGILATLTKGLRPIVGYELLCKLVAALIFSPGIAWLLASVIESSSDGAVSNYDLVGFFLSPPGLLFLAIAVSLAFTVLFFEFGGLMALWVSLRQSVHLPVVALMVFLARSFPRLWKLSLRQFAGYLIALSPGLALAGLAFVLFLSNNDINYYLQTKPREYWLALIMVGLGGVISGVWALRLFIAWLYSVPLLLFTDRGPKDALTRSRELLAGHGKEWFFRLAGWALLFLLLSAASSWAIETLSDYFVNLTKEHMRAALALAAFTSLLELGVVAVVNGLGLIVLAALVAESFLNHSAKADFALPETLTAPGSASEEAKRKIPLASAALLVAPLVATFTGYNFIKEIQFDHEVVVTAHRGSSITAPENTMAAIKLAMEEKADMIEIDAQRTSDGVIVLLHDKDLKRVTQLDKGIWEVTYDEIKDLDIGSWFDPEFAAERIPTLSEVIDTVRGKCQLNIELKFNGHDAELSKNVVDLVKQAGFLEQSVFTSLDYQGLLDAKEADPSVKTGLIVTAALGDVTRLNVDFLSVSAASVNRNLLSRARDAGMEVHVWTVNEIPQMNAMIGLGVDSIITDVPALLVEVAETRQSLTKVEKALLQLGALPDDRW